MRFIGRRRFRSGMEDDDDPLTGLANLFDLGLVFIVGLLVMVFSAYHLQDLLSETSELTITKKTAEGRLEIITKKGKRIKAVRVTESEAKGRGERLGTAYRLEDGTTCYVPE